MDKRRIAWFVIVFSAILLLSVSAVFAQEIDIDSMSDEQLMVLLVQITDRLGLEMPQPKAAAEETPEPAGTPYAAAVPEATAEPEYFESWMNKKLVVGALPSYMFIQPTVQGDEGSSDPDNPGKKKDPTPEPSCPVGEPCNPRDRGCTWSLWQGQCICACG